MASQRTPIDRFLAKINFDGPVPVHRPELGPCWLWTGATHGRNGRDYGRFFIQGRNRPAARFAYEFCVGPFPKSRMPDHLCRTTLCVEPFHLEPVTNRENAVRGNGWAKNALKTHCPAGHPYDKRNTRLVRRPGKLPQRTCLFCYSETNRRYRMRLRRDSA